MLADKVLAISFLKQFVPELKEGTDWSSLNQEPGSFIDEKYLSKYSDILFSVKRGERESLIYILIEHKSQQDHWTLFYLLQLIVQIWAKWREEQAGRTRHIPLIIPTVLHQSVHKWSAPINFHQYFDAVHPELLKFIPHSSSKLVDLADVELETIGNCLLETVLSLMKVINEGDPVEWLENHIEVLSHEVFRRMGPGKLILF